MYLKILHEKQALKQIFLFKRSSRVLVHIPELVLLVLWRGELRQISSLPHQTSNSCLCPVTNSSVQTIKFMRNTKLVTLTGCLADFLQQIQNFD